MKIDNIYSKTGVPSEKAKKIYFTGPILARDISVVIKSTNEKIYHVAFNNGSRTKLHSHDGGQTLIVTKGKGDLIIYKKLVKAKNNFRIKVLLARLTRHHLNYRLYFEKIEIWTD